MRIEIDFGGGVVAALDNGRWLCTNKELLPAIRAIAGTVEDSPSIPDLDRERARLVAEVMAGKITTPPAAAAAERVY